MKYVVALHLNNSNLKVKNYITVKQDMHLKNTNKINEIKIMKIMPQLKKIYNGSSNMGNLIFTSTFYFEVKCDPGMFSEDFRYESMLNSKAF